MYEFTKAIEECIEQCKTLGSGCVQKYDSDKFTNLWLTAEWTDCDDGRNQAILLNIHYIDTGRVAYATLLEDTKIPKAKQNQQNIIVIYNSFDADTKVYHFPDKRMAQIRLMHMWETLKNTEIREKAALNQKETYCKDDYGQVMWENGDYTRFILTSLCEYPA